MNKRPKIDLDDTTVLIRLHDYFKNKGRGDVVMIDSDQEFSVSTAKGFVPLEKYTRKYNVVSMFEIGSLGDKHVLMYV